MGLSDLKDSIDLDICMEKNLSSFILQYSARMLFNVQDWEGFKNLH